MTSSTVHLSSDALSVTIAALGAEMQTLRYRDTNLLWHGDPAWWAGRSPVLFPIVGPALDGAVTINGQAYEMAQHGFARRLSFELTDQSDTTCTHELRDRPETRAQYPFSFSLRIIHAIDGGTLTVTAEVENRGEEMMPFGFGFHPAFLWPLPGQPGIPHTITLDNKAEPPLARMVDQRLPQARLPSPFQAGRLILSHDQFDADALLFPEGAGDGLRYGVANGPGLKFSFRNLPNLAIWSKPGPAPFVCVEPWHGMLAHADTSAEIAERPDSLLLPPGETATFSYSVTPEF